jgi:hypothetical protein
LAKTDAEIANTYLHVQTDGGRFAFHFVIHARGRHQERYLPVPRLYKERGQKLEYKCIVKVHFSARVVIVQVKRRSHKYKYYRTILCLQ